MSKDTLTPKANQNVYDSMYFGGLLLLVLGLVFSKPLLSIAEGTLALSLVLRGKLFERIKEFFSTRENLILVSFYLLLCLGMIHTQDSKAGLDELRIKLPLLVLPILLLASPTLTKTRTQQVLTLFLAAVTASTIISTGVLLGIGHKAIQDIREISLFMSNIRLALLVVLSFFLAAYRLLLGEREAILIQRVMLFMLCAWLLFFLVLLESLTGILLTLFIAGCFGIYTLWKSRKGLRRALLAFAMMLVPLAIAYYLNTISSSVIQHESVNFASLDSLTAEGNRYEHRAANLQFENGHAVWVYVCKFELERDWNKRSSINFLGKDEKGQFIEYTLIRFLASRGLRKDAGGVRALTADDVRAIERGAANFEDQQLSSMATRVRQTTWELKNFLSGGNPTGHSVTQRIEFWRTAQGVIQANPVFGVGTGDSKQAMDAEYMRNQSPLAIENRLMPHNEYLLAAVMLGIPGLLVLLIALVYPVYANRKKLRFAFVVFFILAFLSMLTEDTLGTQVGVTFYAFFNAFFLSRIRNAAEAPTAYGI